MNRFSRQNVHTRENTQATGKQTLNKTALITRPRSTLGDIKNVVDAKNAVHKKVPGLQKGDNSKSVTNLLAKVHVPNQEVHLESEECSTYTMQCDTSLIVEAMTAVTTLVSSRDKLRLELEEASSDLSHFSRIDLEDSDDPKMVTEYVMRIFDYLQEREATVQPMKSNFMAAFDGKITSRMRYILVDWLVLVHKRYTLLPETLHLTIAIIDRYIQSCGTVLAKNNFQLLGITALLVASKFEEMYPPDIMEFVNVCDNTYSSAQVRAFEITLLEAIDFYLSIPLPLTFLRRFSRLSEANACEHNMAKYLLELTLVEYDLCHVSANERAAAALCLSMCLLRSRFSDLSEAWSAILQYHSGLKPSDLADTVSKLAAVAFRQDAPSKYRAVYMKYQSDSFMAVSLSEDLVSPLIQELANLRLK